MAAIIVGSRTFATTDDLEKLVVKAATQYDIEGYAEDFDGNEVTDPEYDDLVRVLRKERPNSDAFKGTKPSMAKTKGDTVKHVPPMTSIAKADGTAEEKRSLYDRWLADITKRLGHKPRISQSFKRDGIALRVNYVDGKLISAGLRPRDGINGSDVTRHMKYIEGVPQKLPHPFTLSLNGEIECHFDDFKQVNEDQDAAGEDPYKNPRGYTNGCLGRDDPEENKNCRLRVTWYSITGFDDWDRYYKDEVERAIWVNNSDTTNVVHWSKAFNDLHPNGFYVKDGLGLVDANGKGYFVQMLYHTRYDELELMEQKSKELPYYTDGVVLKVADLAEQEELGHVGDDPVNDPRGALAWKYEEQKAEATVSRIEWNASRTGRVVPTAIFDTPFVLQDTENSRATCNNYGWMESQGLGPGAVVICKKGGKIIPNICGVKTPVKSTGAPANCPTCGTKLGLTVSDSGNKDLLCPNKACGAKHIKAWTFYFQKLGAKGLGTAAMEKILHSGKVKTLADFYTLTLDDLTSHGFSDRQALLALATIWMVKPTKDDEKLKKTIEAAQKKKFKVQAWLFFAALGIPQAGETAGKALVAHFKDFGKIAEATEEELLEVNGVGPTTAENIRKWFDEETFVDDLLQRVELELPKVGKLTGTNFVLTGDFALGKKVWKQRIEEAGGNCQGAVSKTTNYVVKDLGTGGAPSDKEEKALKLGVPIIGPKDLEKML